MRYNLIVAVSLCSLACLPVGAQQIQSHVTTQPSSQPAKSASGVTFSKCDSKAPIGVDADSFAGDFNTKIGSYIGNVVATQSNCKLRSDKMDVNIVESKPNKIFAHGNVVFATTSGTATGDEGLYDLNDPPTVTLSGKVVLTKEKNVMRGTLLVIDVNTGIAHLTAKGDRVKSILNPKQAQGAGSKASAGGSHNASSGTQPDGSDGSSHPN
jgi:lipopolysaccharide export system protein LptA